MLSKLLPHMNKLFTSSKSSTPMIMAMRSFSVGLGHPPSETENPVRFKFAYSKDDQAKEVLAREGETLLEVAHNNHIDLEGACA